MCVGKLRISKGLIFLVSLTDHAHFDLAVTLIKETSRGGGSMILSPASISTALYMVYLAANGETRQELWRVLGRNARKIEIQRHFGKLLANIDDARSSSYTLNIANRLYVRRGFSIQPSFLSIIQFHFGETLHYFTYEQRDQFAQEINNWVSIKTNNRIRKLMVTAKVNSETEMLVFNIIYFQGIWKKPFISEHTQNDIFHISQSETKKMPMMLLRAELPYYEDHLVRVVKLPYVGDEVEMVIILPKILFNLPKIQEMITGKDLINYVYNATRINVELKLPKFGLEAELNLEDALRKLGVADIFSENANFRGLSNNPISVSNIIHKASFEVNEQGTGIMTTSTKFNHSRNLIPTAYSFQHSVIFNANQPFMYFVVKNLKTILYAGQCGRFCYF
uniref:SERPIN domain-containing protein n=1 Tax=Elaeophora elaphi TaxID=1147741 RepID=A0A0R3RK10_9BILA